MKVKHEEYLQRLEGFMCNAKSTDNRDWIFMEYWLSAGFLPVKRNKKKS